MTVGRSKTNGNAFRNLEVNCDLFVFLRRQMDGRSSWAGLVAGVPSCAGGLAGAPDRRTLDDGCLETVWNRQRGFRTSRRSDRGEKCAMDRRRNPELFRPLSEPWPSHAACWHSPALLSRPSPGNMAPATSAT